MAAKSRTAKFYATHAQSRKKRLAYQAEFNKKPEQVKKRVEAIKYNRAHGGVGDGMDASHGRYGRIVGFSKPSSNRGDKNNTKGDRSARGKKR